MQSQCELNRPPCNKPNEYDVFDAKLQAELKLQLTADMILNQSAYCAMFARSFINNSARQTYNINTIDDYFRTIDRRIGVYHIWDGDVEFCGDHSIHKIKCVYVGKGKAKSRIRSHFFKKFEHSDIFFVTFYECENRIAKYLEQLFLDLYNFEFNKNENNGNDTLYCRWNEDRYCNGTETRSLADHMTI